MHYCHRLDSSESSRQAGNGAGLDLGPGQLVSGHLEREVTVIRANMAPQKGSHAPLHSFPFWTRWLVG